MNIKTVLIEDNKQDLQHLINELKEISFIDVIGSFSNPVEAITFIKENKTDLVISDIKMPGINGIAAIKLLAEPPLVIFISSYPEYAVESFEVKPLHYLVKPFSKENLLKATYRALESIKMNTTFPDDFMFIYTDKIYEKVSYSDMQYIKAEQNYSKVVTEKKSYLVLTSLSKFISPLPEQFMRIHKSYAVNMQNITSYNQHEVLFNDAIIPISEAYKEETLDFLSKFTPSRKK
ncbi:MAG: LytR/AlgR family response regulator transcription factor [Legionellales bacterium]